MPEHSADNDSQGRPLLLQHDLGNVLAQNQFLRDEFSIENSTPRPIRLIKGIALKPCCSSIEKLPSEVPAHGKVALTVAIRPGYQSGLMRVEFEITTDSDALPVIRLVNDLHLTSSFEVEKLDGADESLPIGVGGKQRFRISARRIGTEGGNMPHAITCSDGLIVAAAGPDETKATPDGLVESTREFDIQLPPRSKKGPQRAEIMFRWPDGRTKGYMLGWEVRQCLTLSPPGIVVKQGKQPLDAHLIIYSDQHPFKIKKITSPLLIGTVVTSSKAAARHEINLKIDQSAAQGKRISDILITTDHPNQGEIGLTVLILPD
jgi:hypothetical protein